MFASSSLFLRSSILSLSSSLHFIDASLCISSARWMKKHNGRNWIVCFHVDIRLLFRMCVFVSVTSSFHTLYVIFCLVVFLHFEVHSLRRCRFAYTPNNQLKSVVCSSIGSSKKAEPLLVSLWWFHRFVLIKSSIWLISCICVCVRMCMCTVWLT